MFLYLRCKNKIKTIKRCFCDLFDHGRVLASTSLSDGWPMSADDADGTADGLSE